jgi:predicted DsbA family dithiol-disulfide isomerase
MLIEIWSDVVCPWCYIGKRRFERGLAAFRTAGVNVDIEVVWRSFQLNPEQPRGAVTSLEASLAAKTGGSAEQVRAMNAHVTELAAAEGLDYHLDRYRVINTMDAHRVLQMAKANGLGTAAHERLLHAQLVDGELLEDPATLVRLGVEIGLDPVATADMLAGDAYAADVRTDLRDAADLGISAVPFFVFNRAYGVAGAQPAEVFSQVLAQVAGEVAGEVTADVTAKG